MEDKIKSINEVLKAFESRNEKLHEEIRNNEEAIKEMQEELKQLLETEEVNLVKMA